MALMVVEAELREQIAQEIEAGSRWRYGGKPLVETGVKNFRQGNETGLELAAQIVRGKR